MAAERTELTDPGPSAERLSERSVERLAAQVERPGYRRSASGVGIAHLGVGAFMRAHTAVYCDDAMSAAGGDWRIAGVSLRSGAVRDQLAPQDGLYTLCVRDQGRVARRLIGAIDSMHVAPEYPSAIVALLANPAIRIVTLTVTEKGYCLEPGSGELDLQHALIRHDLANPAMPESTVGFLVAGLKMRYHTGGHKVTIVSCDNLPGNGRRLRNAVLTFVAQVEPDLRGWIADEIAFPETMVDRIVPATSDADIVAGTADMGLRDAALVKTEAFRQWVIEDRFAGERPAWEAGGALFVPDVEPYESAKLRLLNGAHSTLAYLGYLAGHEYVHEAMQSRQFSRFMRYLMTREISPVTPEPDGMRHAEYIDALLRRFANPSLEHRNWQIAMDGSQKLPQRLLKTAELRLAKDWPIPGIALAVAGWMRYALGRDDNGGRIDVSDPLSERFAAIAKRGPGNPDDIVGAFLELTGIFGSGLRNDARFRAAVSESLRQLDTLGAAATVQGFMEHENDNGRG